MTTTIPLKKNSSSRIVPGGTVTAVLLLLSILAAAACSSAGNGDASGPGQILAQMRADTAWIRHLDTLSWTAIGPGARCLDPVSHSFSYDGRTWLFNQDWGGVMEIPAGYAIEDDPIQAELSFHGTRAFSPDSAVVISCYAGIQGMSDDDRAALIRESLAEDGFTVTGWERGEGVVTVCARSRDGVNFYGRYHPADADGVEHSVSVQYPDGREEEAAPVLEMARRYPMGPYGTTFRGEALL